MNNLDALYQEYEALCRDRGVFPKSRTELHHYDEAGWLTYVIELIKALPSQTKRQATLQNPFREPENT